MDAAIARELHKKVYIPDGLKSDLSKGIAYNKLRKHFTFTCELTTMLSGYTLATLRLERQQPTGSSVNAIYASIYYNKGSPKLISIGPSYLSEDSEYRKPILHYYTIMTMLDKYLPMMTHIEDYLLSQKDIKFHTFVYGKYAEIINKHIRSNRIELLTYMLAWIYRNIDANNLVPNYAAAIYADDNFYENVDMHPFADLINLMNYNADSYIIGQKMRPTPVYDINQFYKKITNVLYELIIVYNFSNMIFRNICPGSPILVGTTYIDNTNRSMYDSTNMALLFDLSVKIGLTSKNIYDIYDLLGNIKNMTDIREQIQVPLTFIINNLLLSPLSQITFSEYSGRPFADLVKMNEYHIILTNTNCLVRIVFDYLYKIACMHTLMNIIHGDLHVNNLLISECKSAGSFALFTVDNQTYVLEQYNIFGTIIDYGRSVSLHSGSVVDNNQDDIFYHGRMLQLIKRDVPSLYEKYQDDIDRLILTKDVEKYRNLFMAASTTDMFRMLESIHTYLLYAATTNTVIDTSINWIQKLRDDAYIMMTTNIERAIQDESADIFPILIFIKRHFDFAFLEKWQPNPDDIVSDHFKLDTNVYHEDIPYIITPDFYKHNYDIMDARQKKMFKIYANFNRSMDKRKLKKIIDNNYDAVYTEV